MLGQRQEYLTGMGPGPYSYPAPPGVAAFPGGGWGPVCSPIGAAVTDNTSAITAKSWHFMVKDAKENYRSEREKCRCVDLSYFMKGA